MEEQLSLTLTPAMLVIVPIVATLLQVLKRIEIINKIKDWLPVISVVASILLAYLSGIGNPILAGVIIGLVAAGGYDVAKLGTNRK